MIIVRHRYAGAFKTPSPPSIVDFEVHQRMPGAFWLIRSLREAVIFTSLPYAWHQYHHYRPAASRPRAGRLIRRPPLTATLSLTAALRARVSGIAIASDCWLSASLSGRYFVSRCLLKVLMILLFSISFDDDIWRFCLSLLWLIYRRFARRQRDARQPPIALILLPIRKAAVTLIAHTFLLYRRGRLLISAVFG